MATGPDRHRHWSDVSGSFHKYFYPGNRAVSATALPSCSLQRRNDDDAKAIDAGEAISWLVRTPQRYYNGVRLAPSTHLRKKSKTTQPNVPISIKTVHALTLLVSRSIIDKLPIWHKTTDLEQVGKINQAMFCKYFVRVEEELGCTNRNATSDG